MTEQETTIIAEQIKRKLWRWLEFDRIENGEVWAGYDGPRMVYQEASGTVHRLSPGMLKIDSQDEWRAIRETMAKGLVAEFWHDGSSAQARSES